MSPAVDKEESWSPHIQRSVLWFQKGVRQVKCSELLTLTVGCVCDSVNMCVFVSRSVQCCDLVTCLGFHPAVTQSQLEDDPVDPYHLESK